LWKSLHPSEDGEALFQSQLTPASIDTEAPNMPENLAPQESHWFAVYTTCRHEKRVAEHLRIRQIEHYLPLYRSDRKWRDGSKVTLDLPLFPCYLFVRVDRTNRRRVLEVPGALAVVGGTGGGPAPLPQSAINALRAGLVEKRVEPHPLTTVGQRVRIRRGAFAGMEGVVARKKKGSLRVVLTLDLIMQSIAVEVDELELESAGTSPTPISKSTS
jgi:transcription antitermination factor NusG